VKDGKLYFSIVDTGVGITPEKLKEIRELLNNDHVESVKIGFGIFNVNERIRLSFGKEYGLAYSSVYQEGTMVEVWHPLL